MLCRLFFFFNTIKKKKMLGQKDRKKLTAGYVVAPVLDCPPPDFLVCGFLFNKKSYSVILLNIHIDQGSPKPTDLQQLVLKFGFPFATQSLKVLANLDHLVLQKPCAAQSPRLTQVLQQTFIIPVFGTIFPFCMPIFLVVLNSSCLILELRY